jgi:acetolactate synthase-1/3 small subunit
MNTQTVSLLLENKPGALARVVGILSGLGYNILSLTAAPSEDSSLTRATVVFETDTDPATYTRVVGKLNKLIPILSVVDVTGQSVLAQEMMLARLRTFRREDAEAAVQIAGNFGARIVGPAENGFELQAVACPSTMNEFVSRLRCYGTLDLVRSGLVALVPLGRRYT